MLIIGRVLVFAKDFQIKQSITSNGLTKGVRDKIIMKLY